MTTRVSIGRVLADTGRQYWGHTGVNGLSNAYSAEKRPLRLIWLVLFAIGLVFTVIDVIDVFTDYYSYPHSTQMEVVYDRSAHFPAVTVCSQSKIDCLRLVNASMNAPEDKRLNRVLHSFGCLGPKGLECPYVWTLAASAMTEDWLATHDGREINYCLRCQKCSMLQKFIFGMKQKPGGNERAKQYEGLFTLIGCSTTCPPPPAKQTSGGRGTAVTGTADDGGTESTGTADGGGTESTGTADDGGTESTGTADDGGTESTGTADDGGTESTGTADDGGTESTGTADDGGTESTGTADDGGTESTGTADNGGTESSGTADGDTTGLANTADGRVLKSRAKRSAGRQTAQMEDGSPDQEDKPFFKRKLNPADFQASKAFDADMISLNLYMELSEDQRISIGTSREDLIKDCTYLGTNCNDPLLFRTTSSPEYGNCFTFNANVTESSDPLAGERVTGLTGQQYSLDLLLNLNHHTFPPVAATKGARVQVHQPDQEPDVEDSGMSVMPNAATSIAIEQLTIQRLPSPYAAQCISSWKDAEYRPERSSDEKIKESYSTTRCQKMCLQSLFIENCGCLHAKYPAPITFRKHGSSKKAEHVKPCLLTAKGNDTVCTTSIQKQFDNGTVTCHCPTACFEKSFNAFQSMALWPRDVYLDTAASQMNIDLREMTRETRTELASNVLDVKVFFKTLNTATLSQSPSYTSSSVFFSSLGGAMSLYLGISIIMVAEILEFFCLLGWNLYQRARGNYVSPGTPGDVEPNRVGEVKKVAIKPNGVEITYIGDSRLPLPKLPYQTPT